MSICGSRLVADNRTNAHAFRTELDEGKWVRDTSTHRWGGTSTQRLRHTAGGDQVSGYSAGWRLCLTDRPSYINLTDAGSGSSKASWPHTGTHSHKEADAHTHRPVLLTQRIHAAHGRRPASKSTHTHLTSHHNGYWGGGRQTLAIFTLALRHLHLFPLFPSTQTQTVNTAEK